MFFISVSNVFKTKKIYLLSNILKNDFETSKKHSKCFFEMHLGVVTNPKNGLKGQ